MNDNDRFMIKHFCFTRLYALIKSYEKIDDHQKILEEMREIIGGMEFFLDMSMSMGNSLCYDNGKQDGPGDGFVESEDSYAEYEVEDNQDTAEEYMDMDL